MQGTMEISCTNTAQDLFEKQEHSVEINKFYFKKKPQPTNLLINFSLNDLTRTKVLRLWLIY